MFTFKKISIALLVLTVLFVLFGVVATVQAQYGFSKLLGVGGLEQASVGEIIIRIIQWIMGIVGLVCVAFIIYGGVMYATSGGSEEHVERAKKILLWSIIGLVICILAFVIANAVVGAIRGGTTGGGAGEEKWCAKWDYSGHNLRKEFSNIDACNNWRNTYSNYTCVNAGCGFNGTFGNCNVCDANNTNCDQKGSPCGVVADCFGYGQPGKVCLK